MSLPEFTIGIEEEYQIIHAETRELTSYIQEFLDQGRLVLKDQIKPEFLQSQVEVGSRICSNMQETRDEVVRLRKTVCDMAQEQGLRVAAAGTHPFSSWSTQQVTAGERYTKHEQNMAGLRGPCSREDAQRSLQPDREYGPCTPVPREKWRLVPPGDRNP